MKKLIMSSLMFILLLTACISQNDNDYIADGNRIKILITIFPLYDFTREIIQDTSNLTLLLPPGIEIHSFEPTAKEILRITDADVFIFMGEELEPWVGKIASEFSELKAVIDSSQGIALMENNEYNEKDPHIWLDPIYAMEIVENILDGLILADPENETAYKKNAEEFKEKIQKLNDDISTAMEKTKYNTIIYGGHFAFGYFARRYGLEYISPYHGFSPDSEPTPQNIANMIDVLNETESKYIYFEEMIEPRVAKIISAQTGAEMLLLHGVHNVTKQELNEGISYLQIMRDNLERLKLGLGYYE